MNKSYKEKHKFEASGESWNKKPLCKCGLPQDIPTMHFKEEKESPTKDVTRFEVIDHTKSLEDGGGRVMVKYGVKVDISMQDRGRTIKVFLTTPTEG